MPPTIEVARWGVAGLYALLLIFAGVSDVRHRRIPNWTVLGVLVLFGVWIFVEPSVSLLSAFEAAGIALVASIAFYLGGLVGAGDSKLFTAVALFAGMTYLPHLALATVLVGGIIAFGMLVLRPQRALAMFALRGKGDFGPGIPYGVAIGLAGLFVVFGPMTGSVRPFGQPAHISVHDIDAALAGRGHGR